MNNLDSQLIFEAYHEEVIDERLKDMAKKQPIRSNSAATAASALVVPQPNQLQQPNQHR